MKRMLAYCLTALVLATALAAQVAEPPEYKQGLAAVEAEDYVKARALFEKGAAAGHPSSIEQLGDLYFQGYGVTMDEPAAVALFRKAAALGERQAIHQLGIAYGGGYGVPKDAATAIEWYTKADALGHPASAFRMAQIYDKGLGIAADKPKAVALYRRAAGLGHAQAMNDLGVMLEIGDGTPVDLAEARAFYQKGADLDYPHATFNLGRVVAEGIGAPADIQKGIELYKKAVELGSGEAANNLSFIYERGEGVEKNRVTAKQWAQRGADLGNANAARRVSETFGDIRPEGEAEYEAGLRADNKGNKAFALELYTRAMDKGHVMGTASVAEAYRDGRLGVPKDPVKGRELTQRCAEMGNNSCQTILAQLLMRGTGGPVDHEGARKWFEAAALKGNTLAMWFLAEMYDKGQGIPRNDALASYWYNVAYSKGSAKAEAVLKARGLLVPDPRTQAYLTRIEKEGPSTESVQAFMYDVAVYCKFGGKKCHELTVAGQQFMQQRNATAESANLQRIWNAYAAPDGASDEAWRQKSDCMRKKTESMQRHNSGQQDWYYAGDC